MPTPYPSGWIPSFRRLEGAIVGGIVAGLVLSIWMLIGEVASGVPSQLTTMERQIATWFGATPIPATSIATMSEEYIANMGHWLLSAGAGAAYAFLWRRDTSVVLNGLGFGAAFFIAAHAIVGPLLHLTPGMWNMPRPVFLTGCVINGFFGLCTAYFANRFDALPGR